MKEILNKTRVIANDCGFFASLPSFYSKTLKEASVRNIIPFRCHEKEIRVIGDQDETATLKLTRSIRRQIYTADLVFAMSTCLDGDLPKKTIEVLARIQARIDNINKILYGGGRFVLAQRDWEKYNRIIKQMKTMIINISDDNKLGPDFFNAVMMMVEDAYESVTQSKNKRLQHEWAMLRQSMGTFCKHVIDEPEEFDPDWIGYKYESIGAALGEKFKKVMMS